MLSADAPSHRARPYIWIKLATAMDDVFAHLEFFDLSTDISDVASLACSSFSHWQLDAGQVRVYMVAKAGEPKPTSSDIDNALLKEPLKITAPVESGTWLVAKPTQSMASFLPGLPGGKCKFTKQTNDLGNQTYSWHAVLDSNVSEHA